MIQGNFFLTVFLWNNNVSLKIITLFFSVVHHLLQYFYKYTSTILDDAQKVSSHSRKEMIDAEDIKFAVKVSQF